MNEYTADVAAGARWLDEFAPGWASRIHLDTLNINDPEACVAGQVFAADARRDNYSNGWNWARDNAPGMDCCHMAMCTEAPGALDAWRLEVIARTVDTGKERVS